MNPACENPASLRLCASVLKNRLPFSAAVRRAVVFAFAAFAAFAPARLVAGDNDWTYYAADADDNPTASAESGVVACIARGGFVIGATYDAESSPNAITLGAIASEADDHVLDLRGMSVGGTAISALTLPNDSSWKESTLVEFYASGLTGFGAVFDGCPTIRTVEVASDTITDYINNSYNKRNDKQFVAGCGALGRLVLDCPKLATYDGKGLFEGTVISNDIQDVIKPWTVKIGANAFASNMDKMTGSLVLTNLYADQYNCYLFGSNWSVTNIYIKWQGETMPEIGSPQKAKRVVIEAPNAVTATGCSFLYALEMTGEEFLPPWLQEFRGGLYRCVPVTGNVVMTNLTTVGKHSNNYGVFWGGTKLSSAELSGPVGDFAAPWTERDSPLERASLNFPNLTNTFVSVKDKKGAISLKEDGVLEIFGPPWGEHVMTNLLARFAAIPSSPGTAPTNLTVRCSRKQGWKAWAQAYGDDFPRSRAPQGCFGVWREGEGASQRGAWLVHMPQDTDPKAGALLIVR